MTLILREGRRRKVWDLSAGAEIDVKDSPVVSSLGLQDWVEGEEREEMGEETSILPVGWVAGHRPGSLVDAVIVACAGTGISGLRGSRSIKVTSIIIPEGQWWHGGGLLASCDGTVSAGESRASHGEDRDGGCLAHVTGLDRFQLNVALALHPEHLLSTTIRHYRPAGLFSHAGCNVDFGLELPEHAKSLATSCSRARTGTSRQAHDLGDPPRATRGWESSTTMAANGDVASLWDESRYAAPAYPLHHAPH